MIVAQHQKEKPMAEGWNVINCITMNDPVDERDLWHPGGLDVCGQYVAIPIEDWTTKVLDNGKDGYLCDKYAPQITGIPLKHKERRSKIIFYDMTDPLAPKRLKVCIERNSGFCPAIAFTRIADGRFLVYSNGGDDIHISKTANLEDGFKKYGEIPHSNVDGQNLSFVTIGPKGDLYLVGTYNNGKAAPIISGADIARVWKFDYDPDTNKGVIKEIAMYTCDCGEAKIAIAGNKIGGAYNCNFNAAANVTPNGDLLALYHYVIDNGQHLSCTLFGPNPENP